VLAEPLSAGELSSVIDGEEDDEPGATVAMERIAARPVEACCETDGVVVVVVVDTVDGSAAAGAVTTGVA